MRDRRAGGIDRRRVLRGGSVTVVRTASVGVLHCRDRGNVLDRVRGGLARQFTGLMAQAIVARVSIPQLRLIVHMPGGLASDTRGVAISDRRRGGVDRRRVFRGGTVTMVRTASLGVLDCRDRRNVLRRGRGGLAGQFMGLMAQTIVRISQLRLIVRMPGGLASQARGVEIRDRRRGCVARRRVFRGGALIMGRMAFVGVLDCRDRWNVLGCVRGGLVREFTELMAQTIVARYAFPNCSG